MELAKLYKHLGGEPGTSKARIDAFLAEPETSTPIEREAAQVRVRDEYLGVLLFTRRPKAILKPYHRCGKTIHKGK